ncbi:MAG: ABC transporter ATP-binding protein [Burkholderiales bacterium]|nr:ABC transporter ATP-binding protein [Burkholderiales bacterium]
MTIAAGAPAGSAGYLSLRDVAKSYESSPVVDIAALDIGEGELFALLGPSGCGKSTTLRLIAGFESHDRGGFWLAGQALANRPIHKRDVAMVFQDYALFPHMSVFDNVAFGLRMRRVPAAAVAERVSAALGTVRLQGFDHRLPRELSGGQQQRVAIARALVVMPKLLLLDEPLSNLDAKLREEMREELKDIQKSTNITTIFVTHDIQEAFALADRVGVMNHGRIVQIGSSTDIYCRPENEFVATFVGQSNIVAGALTDGPGAEGRFRSNSGLEMSVTVPRPARSGAPGKVFVRPEHVRLSDSPPAHCNAFEARVLRRTFLGESKRYVLQVGNESLVATTTEELPENGRVKVYWREEHAVFIAAESN